MYRLTSLLQRAESALLEEKAAKLGGLARLLEQRLESDFDALLALQRASGRSREERIRALNAALAPMTDEIAQAFPGVALGYYARDLDAIVAYAPHGEFGRLVGVTIPPWHLGRQVMERGRPIVAAGTMVRGDILNYMHPILRNGRAVGYTFANETVADIYAQISARASGRFDWKAFGPLLGLLGLLITATSAWFAAHESSEPAASEPLRRMREYLDLFLGSLDIGIAITDHAGALLYLNRTAMRMLGMAQAPGRGTSWFRVLQQLLPGWRADPDELPQPGELRRFGPLVATGSQGLPEVDLAVVGIGAPAGAAGAGKAGYAFYLEEFRRARELDEYLQRANRLAAAGELAAVIAHEVRNPLTVVLGSLELLPERAEEPGFIRQVVRVATEELRRVSRIIDGLVSFAHYSSPRAEALDLTEVVRRATDLVRWYGERHGVRVESDLEQGVLVTGDADHLQQAVVNLLLNSIQALAGTGAGGKLRVTLRSEPDATARVQVADNGPGIPADVLPKIWDVFFTTKPGGTGLGLPLVQRIVDQHGGYVDVESSPGSGAVFTIRLPLAARPGPGSRGVA
ncbi:ATP-binding protein [Caldinitratiruptor microaerophilus]|uniref:histidine kinase n=1 Tax=Caldinitratiruptor microaerophilus TaxID=671077 RepID=A0AA35G9Q1_9FIRM|nr:ATP-binding protein [Caldinitratiruptor microaerophilus]BDG62316.1 hypothetical protein caldi_34060 [Caldinitratiruptor microaerophilus]